MTTKSGSTPPARVVKVTDPFPSWQRTDLPDGRQESIGGAAQGDFAAPGNESFLLAGGPSRETDPHGSAAENPEIDRAHRIGDVHHRWSVYDQASLQIGGGPIPPQAWRGWTGGDRDRPLPG